MASDREYLNYILDSLSLTDGITYRSMMGEYLIYCKGKLIGGIYDDRFLVKPTAGVKELLGNAVMEEPYKGGKEMLLVKDTDDRILMRELLEVLTEDLE